MLRYCIVSALVFTLFGLMGGAQADPAAPGANPASYVPFPKGYDMPAGFDFSKGKDPTQADWDAGEARLLGFLEKRDFPALRAHAWQIFAGMTSPTPGGYAVWEAGSPPMRSMPAPTGRGRTSCRTGAWASTGRASLASA